MHDVQGQLDRLEAEIAAARFEIRRLRTASRPNPMSTIATVVSILVLGSWVVGAQGGGATAQRVRAPFEIVDAAGKVVVRISAVSGGEGLIVVNSKAGQTGVAMSGDGNVGVFNAGSAVAGLKVEPNGSGAVVIGEGGSRIAVMTADGANQGQLTLNDAQGKPGAAMSGSGNVGVFYAGTAVAGMKAEGAGHGALLVGEGQGKHYARLSVDPAKGKSGLLQLNDSSGKPVAWMGGAKIGGGAVAAYNASGNIGSIVSGTGQIHVADTSGKTLATMVAENGQGAFSIRSASGTTVLRMGEGANGGLLQIAGADGNAMVEAGAFPGQGIVRTYPLGRPGMGLIGMPGTFIAGLIKQ